jgi:hypothetical protein
VLNVRCVPDALNPADKMPPKGLQLKNNYNSQLRLVFSEGLDGDKIEDQDLVKLQSVLRDGVVTITAQGGAMVPVNRQPLGNMNTAGLTSYYDPSGADFKQRLYGTAPPGPGLVVMAGNGLDADMAPVNGVVGLPSGVAHVCVNPQMVTDLKGNALLNDANHPNCADINIQPFTASSAPANGDTAVTTAALMSNGITVTYSAPANATGAVAGNYSIKVNAATMPASCYMIGFINDLNNSTTMMMDKSSHTQVGITFTGSLTAAPCAIPAGATITLTITNVADQYGVPLQMSPTIISFKMA